MTLAAGLRGGPFAARAAALDPRAAAPVVAVVAAILLVPGLTSPGLGVLPDRWLTIGVLAATYSMLALGLVAATGWAGQFLLGYAGFFAIGAYAYGLLNSLHTGLHLGLLVSVPCAVVACVLAAVAIGVPTLRIRGDYFALVSLAFGETVRIAIVNLSSLTGGNQGLIGIDPLTLLPGQRGVVIDASLTRYAVGWGVVGLIAAWLASVRGRPLGRSWVAVRDDEQAARSLGVQTLQVKLVAAVVAAAIAGVAGCFFAGSQLALAPSSFGLVPVFVVVSAIVLGGMGSLTGAVLGTCVLVALPEVVRDVAAGDDALLDYRMLIYGVALVAVILVRPGGLVAERRRTFGRVARRAAVAPERPPAALAIEGLTVRYGGVTAVDDVSLPVRAGELLGIIGANGSGKTTLLNALSGFHPVAAGSVRLGDDDMTHATPEQRARAGMTRTFQMNRLFEGVSLAENVLVGANAAVSPPRLRDLLAPRPSAALATGVAVERLAGFPDRFPPRRYPQLPGELSYANRRRLEMARARAALPRVLLLDEPTAGMNPVDREELLAQARSWADVGCTVLVVEHHLEALAGVADRIAALDHGVLIAHGAPADVLKAPEVIEALMSLEPA